MRNDDEYAVLGIKIFYEDNAWKFANDTGEKKNQQNKGNKKKIRKQHTQSFLQFEIPENNKSENENPTKMFWDVIDHKRIQITELSQKYHGNVYNDLMKLTTLESQDAHHEQSEHLT